MKTIQSYICYGAQHKISFWQLNVCASCASSVLCVSVYVVSMSLRLCLQDKFLCIYATWCIK